MTTLRLHALAAALLAACAAPEPPTPAPAPAKAKPAPPPAPTPAPAVAPAEEEEEEDDEADAEPSAAELAEIRRQASTPVEIRERGAAAKVWDAHVVDYAINPFYLRGDVDGDGAADFVVGARPRAGGEPRLLVLRAGGGDAAAVWLDDDELLTTPARDGWYIHPRGQKVPRGPKRGRLPKLKGDAIVVGKAESSRALLYWDGARFRSHWLSD